jgi:hypothetical protein
MRRNVRRGGLSHPISQGAILRNTASAMGSQTTIQFRHGCRGNSSISMFSNGSRRRLSPINARSKARSLFRAALESGYFTNQLRGIATCRACPSR